MTIAKHLFLGSSLVALTGTAIVSYIHAGISKTIPATILLLAALLHLAAWVLPAGTPEFSSKQWSDLRFHTACFAAFVIFVIWIVGMNTAFKFGA